MITYLALYLYLTGAWALSECDFTDEDGNVPETLYKMIFCLGWLVLVPIWILRSRYTGG